MIVKFFKSPKESNGKGSVYYLLDKKRVENGTSKILSGDRNDTLELLSNIEFKNKVTFGVLSFEEKDISQEQKKELMQEFEKTLLAGLEKDKNYNILWVEHTDKGRLELNFVIPKIELSTGKSLDTYYHQADLKGINAFQEFYNMKFNYTKPKDPLKQNTIQGSKKEFELIKDYKSLDLLLQKQVENGTIKSRDDLIETLKNNDIEVKKIKNGISVKLPTSKKAKRFKGVIYDEKFTSLGSLRKLIEAERERGAEFQRAISENAPAIIDKFKRELENYRSYKRERNTKKYREIKPTIQRDNNELTEQYQERYIKRNGTDRTRANRKLYKWIQLSSVNSYSFGIFSFWGSRNVNFQNVKRRNDEYRTRINRDTRAENREVDRIIERETRINKSTQKELSELTERTRATRKRLSNITQELSRARESTKNEHDRFTNFNDIYTNTRASFERDVRKRIQEFGRQILRNFTGFRETLQEQGKRCIESGIFEVRKFINQNKRQLERVLSRHRGISRGF